MTGERIAHAPDALWLPIGAKFLHVPAFSCRPADRVLLAPDVREATDDVAASLARALTGLSPPLHGSLELFGRPLLAMPYLDTLKMRTSIGLVQGRGGLLSNRSVRDNVTLPLSVHAGLDHVQEMARVNALLDDLELTTVAHLRPHVLDDVSRFRACVARALVLQPRWVVVEGVGDFEPEPHGSDTWQRLLRHVELAQGAVAVCLPRPIAAFERWWLSHGGQVLRCHVHPSMPAFAPGSRVP